MPYLTPDLTTEPAGETLPPEPLSGLTPARRPFIRWLTIAGIALAALFVLALAVTAPFYIHFARVIDRRLQTGAFPDSIDIYAAPLRLAVGDSADAPELTGELRAAGYHDSAAGGPGTWRAANGGLEIFPGEGSRAPLGVFIASGHISRLRANGADTREASLASPLITTLSANKEKRLMLAFAAIPPVLVHAVVSAEDKRFFSHGGVDLPRIAKAAWIDFRDGRKEEGASTLTMQLVRGLSLDPDKRWKRKIAEVLMTIHLEHQWSKEKIFETYVNQVYLGRQADYSVHGFGAGARMFFGKDLKDISLAEAALLAGLVQRPSYFNPFRYPARARERRDVVLAMMRENRYISTPEYDSARAEPVRVAGDSLSEARAPWFLDFVLDQLPDRPAAPESGESAIPAVHSTIDLSLQGAAEESLRAGMADVDTILAKRAKPGDKPGPRPEAALIALDPRTGEIKALVGGRDYNRSQLDRIFAKRPPGSVFKPFVYAAALDTAVSGAARVYTPASIVDDAPTTFWFGGKPYQPANFRGEHFGSMTLRQALAHSDNVAAVKVAQGVGFDAVVRMARRMGLNDQIDATPAVALGAYQVTPFEIAAAYTAFAEGGRRVKPIGIANTGSGPAQVLDPRTAWLMVSMLEEVMRTGTAAGVRSRGFTLPAGGKTGTSHDGWFAGFTSELLCVVWVGFDDYRDLNLEGARSALPIWTEFMKRAAKMGAYRNAKEFPSPGGIVQARICTASGKLAGDQCPDTRGEYFISGSEPTEKCDLHQAGVAPEDPQP